MLEWCIGLYSSLFGALGALGVRFVASCTPAALLRSAAKAAVENAVEESPGVGRKVIVRITPYAAHEAW